jgi:CRP-like cAMP-binding protein
VINQVDIIHDLNPELTFEKRYDIFHHLYQHMTKIVVSENQSVYLEGSTIEHVYIIKSGLFEFSKKMIHNDQNY